MPPDGNFPASGPITISSFASPGMMPEIQGIAVSRRPLLGHEPLLAAIAEYRFRRLRHGESG
jgi:hypothetical protein